MKPTSEKIRIRSISPYSAAVVMAGVGFILALVLNALAFLSYVISLLVAFIPDQQSSTASFAQSLSALVTLPIGFAASGLLFALSYNFVARKLDLGVSIEIQKE